MYIYTPSIVSSYVTSSIYPWSFVAVFGLRYARVISNIVGNLLYRPTRIAHKRKYNASDVTVMIATLGLNSAMLHRVVKSILSHPIAKLMVVTSGSNFHQETELFTKAIVDPRVQLIHSIHPGRRRKTALAIPSVKTVLAIFQDNKTMWPSSPNLLPLMIAPFEDPKMGAVMPLIEAHHHHYRSWKEAFYNFLGMTCLTRRNHEYRACNAIDGGLSTVPGRFGLFRTEIYADPLFQHGYLNEYVGGKGPLDADDDKFHTRWLIGHGWKMKIQSTPETTMRTENGQSDRYASQVMRWTRTTWRSNPRELRHGRVWRQHPFTATTLALWMIRMSLFHEGFMFWLLYKLHDTRLSTKLLYNAVWLILWIVLLKFNKISHHFIKHPKDLIFLVPYLLFGYFCSLVKVWAAFTCLKTDWETGEPAATVAHEETGDFLVPITKQTKPRTIRHQAISQEAEIV